MTHAKVRFYVTFVFFLGFNVLYIELFLCFSQIKIHSFIYLSNSLPYPILISDYVNLSLVASLLVETVTMNRT